MSNQFPPALFVTGTDTGIGKTVISAMLASGLQASYWKPVQSGLQEETDTQFIERSTALSDTQILPERYRLSEPLSPHASAAIDGVEISLSDFELPDYSTDHLVVEGAGGLLVPLNDDQMIIDLITHLDLPAVLVARSELGTLNHTFLSLEALRKRNIEILGVVLNGPKNESNRKTIEQYSQVDILVEIEPLDEINPQVLKQQFNANFVD